MRAMTRECPDTTSDAEPVHGARAEDDRAAVLGAQANPAAFDTIYERYFDAIFRYCRYRSDTLDDAEDAASVVFARALAAIGRFDVDGRGTFRSWLFAIAHNTMTNRHRDRRPTRPLEDACAIRDLGQTPEEMVTSADEAATLRHFLGVLPPDQRRVVELRLAGLRGSEIAVVIGRSHGSVKMLQLRAFKQLRRLLSAPAESGRDHDAAP